MTKRNNHPFISPQLVEYLRENFPLSEYNSVSTLEDLKFYQGQQKIIDHLEMISKKQEKDNILNVSV